MLDIEFIYKEFPEFHWIESVEIKEKSAQVFCDALEMGRWNKTNINDCPVNIDYMEEGCISNSEHIHDVVSIARDTFDYLDKKSSVKVDCSRDIVIAAALIHDVGKYIEYIYENGQIIYSEKGKYVRHPLQAAILASNYDLPDKLIHAIAVHSFEGKDSFESPESTIVKYADEIAYNYEVFNCKK